MPSNIAVIGARRRRRGGTVAQTLLADTYTRADSALTPGNTETPGTAYTILNAGTAATWGIDTGRLYCAVAGNDYSWCVANAGKGDGTFAIDLFLWGGTNSYGVAFRASDASNLFHLEMAGTTITLYRRQAGAFTSIGSAASVTWVSGDTLRVVLSGASITVKQNTTTILTATDSFNATATKYGAANPNSGTQVRWDNLSFVG